MKSGSEKNANIEQQISTTIMRQNVEQYKLCYSLSEKESDLGIFNNKRLLILNTKDKTVGYCDYDQKIKKNIPFTTLQNVTNKKKVNYETIQSYRNLYKRNSIVIKCENSIYNGKPLSKQENWIFTFKSGTLADEWIQLLKKFKTNTQQIKVTNQGKQQSNKVLNQNKQHSNVIQQVPVIKQIPLHENSASKQQNVNNHLQVESKVKQANITVSQIQNNNKISNEPINNSNNENISGKFIASQKSQNQQINRIPHKQFDSNQYNQINTSNNVNNVTEPKSKVNIKQSIIRTNQLPIEKNSLVYSRDIENPQSIQQQPMSKEEFNKNSINIDNSKNEYIITSSYKDEQNNTQIKNEHTNTLTLNQQIIKPSSKNQQIKSSIKDDELINTLTKNKIINTITTKQQFNTQSNQSKQYSVKRKPISFLDKYDDVSDSEKEFYKNVKTIDWNKLFYSSDRKAQEILKFRQRVQSIVVEVIDEISIKQKTHKPLQILQEQIVFEIDSIHIRIAFSSQTDKLNKNIEKDYRNQYKNYHYFLKCVKNNTIFKVPLCCLVEYKGILALCKAVVKNYQQVSAKQFTNQLNKLENITKIKKQVFYNKQNMILKQIKGKNTEQLVYLDDLKYFLPLDKSKQQIPEQIIQNCNFILSGQAKNQDKLQEIQNIIKKNCEILLSEFQNLSQIILNPQDLKRCLYKYNISRKYIHLLYKKCEIQFLKKYFITELAGKILKKLIKEELHLKLKQLKKQIRLKRIQINSILSEIVIDIMNNVLTHTQNTEKIWKTIFTDIKKLYNINTNIQQIDKIYLFVLLIKKISFEIDLQYFQKIKKQFFNSQILLDYSLINKFKPKVTTYTFDHFQQLSQIAQIIDCEASQVGFDQLLDKFNLRQQKIPSYFKQLPLGQSMCIYLANFIPYQQVSQSNHEFQHLELYSYMNDYFPSYTSIQLSIMAIKWIIKRKKQKIAIEIFEDASEKINFWGGQFHPLLSEIYDYFSFYYLSNADYEQAITLAKSSLKNIIKLLGNNHLLTAQKYYQLGNIYFKNQKKEEAIHHYVKTKQILTNNNKTKVPSYGIIILKLAQLYLNFGKITEVITYAHQSLRIFAEQQQYQFELTDTYQVLARAYQITQQKQEQNKNALDCGKQLNSTQNPKIFEKMFKIAIYPTLIDFTSSSRKCLISIIQNLQIRRNSKNYEQALNYIKLRAQSQIISQVFIKYLKKIDKISREINNKDLIKKCKKPHDEKKSESQDFLILTDNILQLVDESFVIGILREYEY